MTNLTNNEAVAMLNSRDYQWHVMADLNGLSTNTPSDPTLEAAVLKSHNFCWQGHTIRQIFSTSGGIEIPGPQILLLWSHLGLPQLADRREAVTIDGMGFIVDVAGPMTAKADIDVVFTALQSILKSKPNEEIRRIYADGDYARMGNPLGVCTDVLAQEKRAGITLRLWTQ